MIPKKSFLIFIILLGVFSFTCVNSSGQNIKSPTNDLLVTSSSKAALAAYSDGMNHIDMGNQIKAREAFNRALAADPSFGMAYLMRASISPSAKEFAEDLEKGRANVANASAWEKSYAEVLTTYLSGDKTKQLEMNKKIASENPGAARAQVWLGSTYAGDHQTDNAREAYNKAITLNPKWVGGYSALSNSYLFDEPKDLAKAEQNAMKAVELAPKSPGMQIALGDCFRAQNDLQKAKNAYAKAVLLDGKDPAGYYKLGHANSFLGNMEEARKNYAAGGANDITKQAAILNTTYTYLYAGDTKMAEKYLSNQVAAGTGMSITEKNACLNTLAEIALHTGDAGSLRSAVERLKPLSGQINEELGNTPEVKIFGKAGDLHWDAMLAMTSGDYISAANMLEEMKSTLEPINDSRKLESYEHDMGLLKMKQQQYAEAIDHFQKANADDMYNKYCLAKANEAAGNKDKAMQLYKELAVYNFNDVGNALMRNEVKKKVG